MGEKQNKQTLVVIAGATGSIGNAYHQYYSKKQRTKCIGLSRQKPGFYKINLLKPLETQKFARQLELKGIEHLILIHSIGIDKFEINGTPEIDRDKDGIDDEVYKSNVLTFTTLAKPLTERVTRHNYKKKLKTILTFCGIGSISDTYSVPFWQSYSKSKNILREYIRNLVSENTRGMFVNVSSVNTGKEKQYRPCANTTHWITPQEVVRKSIPYIENKDVLWQEIALFRPNPKYTPSYFKDHKKLLEKWIKDLGPSYDKNKKPHPRI
ncbi:hypothetical protein KY348_01425 [Candidatus Woesearchaeota archaeon]|nr:hypothetical protein [Candidatus Woesearchaeota archaeon]